MKLFAQKLHSVILMGAFQLGAILGFYGSFSPLYSLGSCLLVVYPADVFAAAQKVGEKVCEGLDQQ